MVHKGWGVPLFQSQPKGVAPYCFFLIIIILFTWKTALPPIGHCVLPRPTVFHFLVALFHFLANVIHCVTRFTFGQLVYNPSPFVPLPCCMLFCVYPCSFLFNFLYFYFCAGKQKAPNEGGMKHRGCVVKRPEELHCDYRTP